MRKGGIIGYFMRNIVVRHRISVRDGEGSEMFYTHRSLLEMIGILLAVVAVTFAAAMLLCNYTPILDIFPNSVGFRSRELMDANLTRIDSLGGRVQEMMDYVDNITMILEGKSPVIRQTDDRTHPADSLRAAQVLPSPMDSLLRAQMEGTGRYGLNRKSAVSQLSGQVLQAPVHGDVTEAFDAARRRYATTVEIPGVTQIAAAQNGTVLTSVWTPEQGYIVTAVHPSGCLTVYRGLRQVFKTDGDKVMAGEVIGTVWPDGEEPARLGFELWWDGSPVDPQNYIVF